MLLPFYKPSIVGSAAWITKDSHRGAENPLSPEFCANFKRKNTPTKFRLRILLILISNLITISADDFAFLCKEAKRSRNWIIVASKSWEMPDNPEHTHVWCSQEGLWKFYYFYISLLPLQRSYSQLKCSGFINFHLFDVDMLEVMKI